MTHEKKGIKVEVTHHQLEVSEHEEVYQDAQVEAAAQQLLEI